MRNVTDIDDKILTKSAESGWGLVGVNTASNASS